MDILNFGVRKFEDVINLEFLELSFRDRYRFKLRE